MGNETSWNSRETFGLKYPRTSRTRTNLAETYEPVRVVSMRKLDPMRDASSPFQCNKPYARRPKSGKNPGLGKSTVHYLERRTRDLYKSPITAASSSESNLHRVLSKVRSAR